MRVDIFPKRERLIKSNKIRIGDLSISYYIKHATADSKKHIVFLHGFPFNKNTWKQQLETLPEDVTGIAVDIRGHGNSTSGHGYFSIDVFAKDLGVFLKKMELDNVVLCGVSMGGYIALRAYELFPACISGLVLVDTQSHADDDTAKQKRFDTIQAVLKHGRRPFSIGFVKNVFAERTIQQDPDAVELIKSSIRRNSIETICATLLALAARTDTTDSLPKINVPTLLIRGKEDKITSREAMQGLADGIPSATFIELDGCGHLPNLEDPVQFDKELHVFLSKL